MEQWGEQWSWDDLKVFMEVAGQKSLSQASRTMGQPKSTLSRRIMALERQLGVLLFQRSTRRFELTSQGEILFKSLQPLTLELRRIISESQNQQTQPTGKIRMTAPLDMGSFLLPKLISDFEKSYPDVQLDLDLSDRIVDLIGERFDLAIRAGKLPDSNLKAKLVGSTQFALFASPGYLKKHGKIGNPKDLLAHRGLVFSGRASQTSWTFQSGPLKQKLQFRHMTASTSLALLLELACRGNGIATLPYYMTTHFISNKTLIHVLPDWSSGPDPVYLVFPPYKKLPKRLELLVDHIWTELAVLRQK
jgi:DNA-binding transcriptional LysR family regulator